MRHTALAAQGMGIELRQLPMRGPEQLDAAFATVAEEKLAALIVVTDGVTFNQRARIAQLATAVRLPAMYEIRNFVDAGGLIAYGPSYADLARRGGSYVDRIFRGTNPADLQRADPAVSRAAKAAGQIRQTAVEGARDFHVGTLSSNYGGCDAAQEGWSCITGAQLARQVDICQLGMVRITMEIELQRCVDGP